MQSVLIVDDDKSLVQMIAKFLSVYGIEAVAAYSGETALKKLDSSIGLILLDIKMKDISGMEMCKILRSRTDIPILFLTASASQQDKVLGLGLGADDYITKPFDPIELVARIQAHLRRYNRFRDTKNKSDVIEMDNLRINIAAHKVYKNNREIDLTFTEFCLLVYFIENADRVLTRKQILNNVWKSEQYDENTVTTYVKRLREKIEDDKSNPKRIESIRNVGYLFNTGDGK